MPFPALFAIAVALAMDAFAVSLAAGVCLRTPGAARILRLAFAFGGFQALMPVAGWTLGQFVRVSVQAYDHWIALGLLVLVGGKMIWEGAKTKAGQDDRREPKDPTRTPHLVLLALATSIDAMIVGFSFSVLNEPIWFASLVIGAVCFAITAFGVKLGCLAGRVALVSRYAEFLGGFTLIAIGVLIFVEH
ncbi:MAG: manganese efflux pump [Desulfovibrionaceae bacterium]|nr:manganese efflux pump [Desulfovibrionaceae bacterium]MBF0515146.1 manganese efflux pump [Desulfovibrionaceae bacterium]